jgi:hypothetical protein
LTHCEVLRNDGIFAVKLNPAAYVARPIFKSRKGVGIVFNVNYFNNESKKKEPIGTFKFQGEEMGSPNLSKGNRPTILIGEIECEAGPLLIENGEICWRTGVSIGKFRDDVLRKTKHLALGYTKFGKLIAAFFDNHALWQVAMVMQDLGCVYALNCDGGSSASLSVDAGGKRIVKGNPYVTVGIQLSREE